MISAPWIQPFSGSASRHGVYALTFCVSLRLFTTGLCRPIWTAGYLAPGLPKICWTLFWINFATCKTALRPPGASSSSNVFAFLVSQLLTACSSSSTTARSINAAPRLRRAPKPQRTSQRHVNHVEPEELSSASLTGVADNKVKTTSRQAATTSNSREQRQKVASLLIHYLRCRLLFPEEKEAPVTVSSQLSIRDAELHDVVEYRRLPDKFQFSI